MNVDLASQKAAMRARALMRRDACDPALGIELAAHVLRDCPPRPGSVVAGFWPLPGEIDIRPLLHALAEKKFEICLPVTPKRGEPLAFRRWHAEAEMIAGRFGTKHSDGDEMTPDYILTPLLAFDAQGNRLGYGGGYYDRIFLLYPEAYRLGCAFSVQEMDDVPAGPNDVKLHAIATELGVRRFSKKH